MMKILPALLFIVCWTGAAANDISKINQLKKEAEEAYKKGNYSTAASNYSYLIDTLHLHDEKAIMNLGHAYYHMGQTDMAQSQYQKITLSKNQKLKSMAFQQLGALSNDPKTLQQALAYFKESIKSDPTNQDARYNYELVKKKLEEQEDQNQDQDNQQDQNEEKKDQDQEEQDNNDQQQDQEQKEDQQQKNQDQKQNEENQQNKDEQGSEDQQNQEQNKDKEEKEGQQGEENQEEKEEESPQEQQSPDENKEEGEKEGDHQPKPSPSENMQEMKISEEKAKMILEALKNSEVQYIQQNRRKPSKKKDSDKPDW